MLNPVLFKQILKILIYTYTIYLYILSSFLFLVKNNIVIQIYEHNTYFNRFVCIVQLSKKSRFRLPIMKLKIQVTKKKDLFNTIFKLCYNDSTYSVMFN